MQKPLARTFSRRGLISKSIHTLGLVGFGTHLSSLAAAQGVMSYGRLKDVGPLAEPDENDIRLPVGMSSRVVGVSGRAVQLANGSSSDYKWHGMPDGGACFPTADGWIYTSNSEINFGAGGVGALRFAHDGSILDAYPILKGSNQNCAGGPTPWGTWLTCEEVEFGRVIECDIYGKGSQVRAALGSFRHEAVAIDLANKQAYLTEDLPDGCLYRFTSASSENGVMDLEHGVLEVAVVGADMQVSWEKVLRPNPGFFGTPTRKQIRHATRFAGGEGIWYQNGQIYFTTKHDNRVWQLDTANQKLSIAYDVKTSTSPVLSGVDNITMSPGGELLIAEDAGDMQICVLGPSGEAVPLLQVVGHELSEMTGPAINPAGNRLYFSSQRGGRFGIGLTYEISGRFI